MSPSYLPVTIDGHEIDPAAPRTQAMSDTQAGQVSAAAEAFREVVLHCHWDLVDRTLTLYAANAYPTSEGPVVFNFGDGSAELTEDTVEDQALAEHTYARDGVYMVGVRTLTDRWFTQVAVNWPAPAPVPPEEAP